MPVAVDHLVVAVPELAPAAALYARLLGLAPSWRGRHPGVGTENACFVLENLYVELLAPAGEGPGADLVRGFLAARGPGLCALALRSADLDAEVAALRARRIDAGEPVDGLGAAGDGAERRWRASPVAAGAFGVFLVEHGSPPLVRAAAASDAVAGCDHVVVRTPAPDAAIAFWRDGLGIRLALDRTFPEWGARLVFFRLGGVTLELAAALDPRDSGPGEDRLWGISYRVPDLEGARRRIADAGFDVSEARTGRRPGTRVATVRGEPLGVATLLLEATSAGSPDASGSDRGEARTRGGA